MLQKATESSDAGFSAESEEVPSSPSPQVAGRVAAMLQKGAKSSDVVFKSWRPELAYAKLGILNPKLMEAVAAQALDLIEDFNAQNFGNAAWAYAKLGISNPKLMEAIAAQALNLNRGFNAQNFGSTVWAYAKLGILNPKLMAAIAAQVLDLIGEVNAQNLAHTVLAYATLGV